MTHKDLTLLLNAAAEGDPSVQEQLLDHVYAELRRRAGFQMRRERPGHTLDATGLVHEAWMRLAPGDSQQKQWNSRAHFFAAAAEAMRRILVEHARRRYSQKRGGDVRHVTFADLGVVGSTPDIDVLALNEAVTALDEADPRLAQVVKLRYFVGLSLEETAEVTRRSIATIKRDWTYAKAWLFERLSI